ncbi:hypothetical protein CHLRE_04g230928v5 [Chlamydomonas reinhardtii]|uniref:Sulfhydryl oxidase n=1 Tax=Chlamydomonas reinhardtii TaxID=3055 RepID=A0A2K3DV09_CHLRE|nr:uncharacterized protein CHLRE_04g230928v5 [Chlamydomonas reinhardtii]PNW84344.1 hypothetical protein CHLRE_04g230928v5 [Chlamydomonas reinhardtii]
MVFEPSHVALQLAVSNFTDIIGKQTATQQCLVEFYASWCPACKHFAPTFEKIAKFLSTQKLDGGKLFIARVDCATEVDLCSAFEIGAYPSLLLGPGPAFVAKQRKSLANFEGPRELAPILTWVGAAFNTTLTYVEPAEEEEGSGATAGSGNGSDSKGAGAGKAAVTAATGAAASGKRRPRPPPGAPEWTLADVEGATLMLWQIIGSTPLLHRGAAKREALQLLLAAWAEAHPSPSCKAGSARLLEGYEAAWPAAAEDAPPGLTRAALCGPPGGLAWRGLWSACAGSQPDSRGFSCGLWFLIHTLAARMPSPTSVLEYLRAFNTHFFLCEPCQKHFGRILASPEAAAATASRRDLVLWLWRTHNEVNERLRGIETRYGHSTTGDPEWPKEVWPAPEACPACRVQYKPGSGSGSGSGALPGSWDEEAVYQYLTAAYGPGSAPGADGIVKEAAVGGGGGGGGVLLSEKGLYSRRVPPPTSTLYSMLPVAGVLAAALMLYIFVRRMRVAAAAGVGGGRNGGAGRHVLGSGGLRGGGGSGSGHWGGGGHGGGGGGGGLWGGGGVK